MRRQIQYSPDEQPRLVTKLELLPEESLYLVERGSLLCFKQDTKSSPFGIHVSDIESESSARSPMTVQQAFAEMIGREGLNLASYQVSPQLLRDFAHKCSNASFSATLTSNDLASLSHEQRRLLLPLPIQPLRLTLRRMRDQSQCSFVCAHGGRRFRRNGCDGHRDCKSSAL
jgi:hypothetical protein